MMISIKHGHYRQNIISSNVNNRKRRNNCSHDDVLARKSYIEIRTATANLNLSWDHRRENKPLALVHLMFG